MYVHAVWLFFSVSWWMQLKLYLSVCQDCTKNVYCYSLCFLLLIYNSPGWQGIKNKFVITSKKPFLWAETDGHGLSCACRQDQLQAAPTSVGAAPGDRQRPCTLPLLGWRWELGAVEVQGTAIVSVTDGTPSSFCKESAIIIVTTGNTRWLLSVLVSEQDGRKGGAWRYID